MPTSAILVNGKRGNYYKMITSLEYKGCNDAIKRIVPRINLKDINSLIEEVEQLTLLQKDFLKKILKLRKELILDKSYSDVK